MHVHCRSWFWKGFVGASPAVWDWMKSETRKACDARSRGLLRSAHRPCCGTPGLCLHAGVAATETRSREVENQALRCLNYTFPVILERNSHTWTADWQYTTCNYVYAVGNETQYSRGKVSKGAQYTDISWTARVEMHTWYQRRKSYDCSLGEKKPRNCKD